MSFNFEWPEFSPAFYDDARQMLAQALNKGQKPPIIADRIEVTELHMGTIPPELEILEIGDLSTDRFRGIFRLTYSGDAYIVLQTKVQANPLNVPRPSLDILGSPRILFAAAPLIVPMTLRLSSLSLRAIIVLVVSRQKGITLVFKNDPLESVQVSSSFDGVDSVAGFIQTEIENQLREAFRSDLPGVIHRLSQKWLAGEVASAGKASGGLPDKAKVGLAKGFGEGAKIETRTTWDAAPGGGEGSEEQGRGPAGRMRGRGRGLTRRMSGMSDAGESVELGSQADSTWSAWGGGRQGRNGGGGGSSGDAFSPTSSMHGFSTNPATSPPTISHDMLDSVPDSIENYDPTYGLRPDSIPHHAGFADYERRVKAGTSKRGLGDVLEVEEEEAEDDDYYASPRPQYVGDGSFEFEMIGLHDLVDDGTQYPLPRTSFDSVDVEPDRDLLQFEQIPAVGGGTVTRPRVFHTQSQMRMRTASTGSLSAHGSPSTATAKSAGGGGSAASTVRLGKSLPFGRVMPLDGRDAYFAAASMSGTSTPRFPFPKQYAPPPAYSTASSAGLVRNTSLPNLSRYPSTHGGFHRSTHSAQFSSSTPSPDYGGRSSLFRSQTTSAYSSPPSSVQSPIRSPISPPPPDSPSCNKSDEGVSLPFSRPSPVDLLSRSPSSVLNTSFLDEEHMPITLNPTRNDSCAHLATLTSSNRTLSPFTRDHGGVRGRSSPHILGRGGMGSCASSMGGVGVAVHPGGTGSASASGTSTPQPQPQPIKAIRKRLHRLGSAKPPSATPSPLPSPSLVGTSTSVPSTPAPQFSRSASRVRAHTRPTTPAAGLGRPASPLRGLALAAASSDYGGGSGGGGTSFGSAAAGLGLGLGRGKKAPSELSDYFPSTGGLGLGGLGGGARERLARLTLGGSAR
ncbi:hypothetical protein JCM11641_002078 [Rhodosporidiobolus odoratus]